MIISKPLAYAYAAYRFLALHSSQLPPYLSTFSIMTTESKFTHEIDDNKNKRMVRCQFCNSLMLREKSANFEQQEYELPLMHQKNSRAPGEIEKEPLSEFWAVGDMMTFENIGFSNTLDRTKFLICCDCEMGPVGYHNIDTKVSYVALSRVKHVD